MSGLRKAMQGGLLSLAMVLLAGAVHAAPDPVLVLGRISDDPKAHYEQLQPLLDDVLESLLAFAGIAAQNASQSANVMISLMAATPKHRSASWPALCRWWH